MKIGTGATVFAMLACAAFSAHAGPLTVVWTPGQTTSTAPGLAGTVTYPNGTISDSGGEVTASTTTGYGFNQGSSPFGEPYWLSLTSNPDQNITFTFAQPVDYVGFFWGSADNSNWVYLYDGATLLGSYEGLTSPIAPGGGSGYADFFAGPGEEITSIELANFGSFTFETDNLSYQDEAVTSTPEPSFFLPLSSLAGLAFLLRRKLRARA